MRILELLQSVANNRASTLCVWGAGRTTDLDLIELVKLYGRIDLVDLHPDLTREAIVQRGFDGHDKVAVLDSTDLTGLGDYWRRVKKSEEVICVDRVAELTSQTILGLPRYDVVVSTCVLSQIIRHAESMILESTSNTGQYNQVLAEVSRNLREQHIRLMLNHVNDGGFAILVTDLTSSKSLPEMTSPDANLNDLMRTVISGNHFPGLNPRRINDSIAKPIFHPLLLQQKVSAPWVWDSLEMQYLCVAFQLQHS